MMKRCYYIANAYDGKYFILTDSVREYVERMAAYVMNLEKSGKVNHYTFGSVEMSASEYESYRGDAQETERARIQSTKEHQEQQDERRKDPSIPLPTPPKRDKRDNGPGLRLV